MAEHELFTKARAELLGLAKELEITNARELTKPQLVRAIASAQAAQTSGSILIPTNRLIFKKAGQKRSAVLRNQTDRPVRLRLEVMDRNGAFEIPGRFQEVTLQQGDSLTVPVQFTPRKVGALLTKSAIYLAGVRVWDLKAKRIVGFIALSGVGPGRVPPNALSCIVHPARREVRPEGNSPPRITISVMPEVVAPGGIVHVSYSVTGADQVWESWGHPGAEVLEDGTYNDWGSWGSNQTSEDDREYDVELGSTTSFEIWARNSDGSTFAQAVARILVRVGYHNARTPGGGVYRGDLNRLRDYLENIEELLNDGCIRNNADLDRFEDPYLRGGLTDDILAAMQGVVIYTSREQLPSAYRETSDLCGCVPCDGQDCCTYGETADDQSWVAICRSIGADDLTLLHELYHYTRGDQGRVAEDKAAAISMGCF